MKNRREFLRIMGLGIITAAVPQTCFPTKSPSLKRPNILFVMADDMGPEWVSSCGAEDIVTPNIDRLATGGMRFTNAYSMPKCTPTRVSLLTGQYPWRTGWINHWDVPRWGAGCHFDWNKYTSFAKIMKSVGYRSGIAGKWQINDFRVQPDALQQHGFDDWCMWTGYETGNPASAERYWNPYIFTRDGSKTYQGRFGPDVFADFLIDFMATNKSEPMMLYYPMVLPHGPLTNTPLDPDVTDKLDLHKAMIRYVDHQVGRLTKALDELGIRENTIIIFTCDNGTARSVVGHMNGRKVRGGKGELRENGMRVPFIANCPDTIPADTVIDALTDFTDMLPTFAEIGGAKLPQNNSIDGHSIAKVLAGKKSDSDREWIMAMGGGVATLTPAGVIPKMKYGDRVIRDKQYKLWVSERKGIKLFDLIADPDEQNNLIDDLDHNIVMARQKLERAIEQFPAEDARPKYDPTAPQEWDLRPGDKYK